MNISFFLTREQFEARAKTVTRRNGWRNLKVGTVLMGVVKGQGIPKGGKIETLHEIRVTKVTRVPLFTITPEDCILEGFPELHPDEFVAMYCRHNGGHGFQTVTRIEFVHL